MNATTMIATADSSGTSSTSSNNKNGSKNV